MRSGSLGGVPASIWTGVADSYSDRSSETPTGISISQKGELEPWLTLRLVMMHLLWHTDRFVRHVCVIPERPGRRGKVRACLFWCLLPCSEKHKCCFSITAHVSGKKLNESSSLLRLKSVPASLSVCREFWGFEVWSFLSRALFCKYLNISIDIPSLPHKHRRSARRGDQRLAVRGAPSEIWCRLTAQLLLFELRENSATPSVIY